MVVPRICCRRRRRAPPCRHPASPARYERRVSIGRPPLISCWGKGIWFATIRLQQKLLSAISAVYGRSTAITAAFEVFRAVMAHGTVTAAAQALQMSQPAATSGLRSFERSIGFRALFERSAGRLRPTPEALSLYEEVDRLFRNVAVVERYAHDLKEAQSGVLTIASTHSLSCDLLPEVIARFRDDHKRVQVWLQVTTTREIIDQALKRQIDFGLIYAPADEHHLRANVWARASWSAS